MGWWNHYQNRTNTRGTYTVTITDANGCTTTASATVNNTNGPSATASATNATCGNSNGSITVTVTGGTAPYTYNWGGGITTQNRTNIAAGTYTVTITDANGCTTTASATVNNTNGPTASASATNATCGNSNGSITVTVSGGTAPYTYNWGGGITTQNRTNIPAGTYSVTITDANTCTANTTIIVKDTCTTCTVSIGGVVSITGCPDGKGAINTTVTGGTGPFTYSWSSDPIGFTSSSANISNLMQEGAYTVVVTDANGCKDTAAFFLIDLPAMFGQGDVTNTNCINDPIGAIELGVGGGSYTFTYAWTGPSGYTSTLKDITGLKAGTYTVIITDVNRGCTLTLTFEVKAIGLPEVLTTVANACKGNNGTVCVTSPYALDQATISDGIITLNLPLVSSAPYKYCMDVPAGTYYVKVQKGTCSKIDTLTVTNNNPIAPVVELTFVNCNNTCVKINVPQNTIITSLTGPSGAVNMGTRTCIGGVGGVTCYYERCNMALGQYSGTVGISDGAGGFCNVPFEFEVTRDCACNAPITINVTDNPACANGASGVIALDATFTAGGGIAPFTWTINGSAIAGGANGILVLSPSSPIYVSYPGNVVVCVKDANGCEKCINYNPELFNITSIGFVITKIPDCNQNNGTGVITINYAPGAPGTCFNVDADGVSNGPPFTPLTYFSGNVCDADGDGVITIPISGLSRSILNIYVTSAGGCEAEATLINISLPVDFTVTPSCNGNDGKICFTPLAGGNLNGYDFVWYQFNGVPGQPGSSYQILSQFSGDGVAITGPNGVPCIDNLPAGLYAVEITDPDGCKVSLCFEVPGGGFDLSFVSKKNTRCGQSTGKLCINVGNEPNATGVNPYLVNLKYQGAGGITILNGIAAIPSNQPGFMNGGSSSNAAFQNAIFNISGNNICGENLPAGIYTFTVTSPSGCVKTISITINEGPDLTTTISPCDYLCEKYDGNIVMCADASYGTGPNPTFTYTWTGNYSLIPNTLPYPACGGYFYNDFAHSCITIIQADDTCQNKPSAINFVVVATDNSANNPNCNATANLDVNFYNEIPITATEKIECISGDGPFNTELCAVIDGSDCLNVSSILWTPLNGGTIVGPNNTECINVSGISINTVYEFLVDVTDQYGCAGSAIAKVTFVPTPTLTVSVLEPVKVCGGYGKICVNSSEPNCTILLDGNPVTLNVGPTCNYIYAHAGTHTITINCGGCPASAYVFVEDSSNNTIDVTCITIPTCKDASNGKACVSMAGGSAMNIRYDWKINRPGFPTQIYTTTYPDSCISNLPAGATYSVVVRDENAINIACQEECVSSIAINLNSLPSPAYLMGIMQSGYYLYDCPSGTCPALNTTSCNTALAQMLAYLNGLGAGTFTGTCNGNTINLIPPAGVTCVYITDNPNVNTTTIPTPCGCFYQTSPPTTGCYAPSTTCNQTCDTTITACIDSCSGTIFMDTLNVVATPNNLICGNTTGDIRVQIGHFANPTYFNKQKPFRIQIKDFTTLAIVKDVRTNKDDTIFVGIPTGNYIVMVTDSFGCMASDTVALTPSGSLITSFTKTDATCGNCNGTIDVTVTGGTTPYTYLWNDGNTNQDRTGLCAGTYSVTITDKNGCTTTLSNIVIANIAGPTATATVTNATCGQNNGAINVTVSGGTAPYTYVWNNGTTTEDRTGLAAGTYSVLITDANGCTVNLTGIVVNNTAGPNASMTKTDATCGNCNGTIDVTVTGGTTPYTYLWNDGNTNQDRTGLCAGTYSVTITDKNGCTTTLSNIVIGNIAGSTATATVTNATCGQNNGAINVTVSGGTAPYTYVWNNGTTTEDRTGLAAGTYSVLITDANGCTVNLTGIVVNNTAGPSASMTKTDATCGNCNGTIDVTVTAGTTPYTYLWNDGNTNQDRTGLCAGTYSVTITDKNGCTTTLSNIVIGNIAGPTATATVTNATCGQNNGAINVTVSGGTAPYTYVWNNGTTTEDRTGLAAGTYSVLITDANGCTVNLTGIVVNNTAGPSASMTKTDATCGNCNGTIDVTVTAGTTPYTYLWNDGNTNQDRTGLCAGTYSVTITDNNGCTTTLSNIVIGNIAG
ncbi:MAG: SprB repeat-containing protein [Bacteroidetes bacterium]|nr:SprB repeat-containing protein [Bacteroidota bacterium]